MAELRMAQEATPATPPSGSDTLYFDISDGALKYVDSTGTVRTVTPPVTLTNTVTLTNKRVQPRLVTVTQSATPATNTDNGDIFTITGLAQAVTSMTTNLTGTPADGEKIEYRITDNGTARAIAWGASFAATTVALPTTTAISTRLRVSFEWDATGSVWACIGTA